MDAAPSPRADRIGGALWMAFGLAIAVGAWRMDRFEQMGATVYTAPGLVPGLYGVLLIVLGAMLLLRRRPADDGTAAGPLINRRALLTLALTLAYALGAVGRVHFGLATAVFVAVFCALFDDQPSPARRIAMALALGLGTAVVVVLVFERVFLVRLP